MSGRFFSLTIENRYSRTIRRVYEESYNSCFRQFYREARKRERKGEDENNNDDNKKKKKRTDKKSPATTLYLLIILCQIISWISFHWQSSSRFSADKRIKKKKRLSNFRKRRKKIDPRITSIRVFRGTRINAGSYNSTKLFRCLLNVSHVSQLQNHCNPLLP